MAAGPAVLQAMGKQYDALQQYADASEVCLQQWEQEANATFTHVYLIAECCRGLIDSLSLSPNSMLIFHEKGGAIFARIHPPAV